jgi:hypothetical protein
MNYRSLCKVAGLKDEMVEFLRSEFSGYGDDNFDFDIEGAIYWFAADNHEGQSSELYSILSSSQYRPGAIEYSPAGREGHQTDRMIMREMYEALENRFGSGHQTTDVDDGRVYKQFGQDVDL